MTELETPAEGAGRGARWKWFLALGVLLLLLGLAGAGASLALELTSLLVFGPLLLASSLIQFLTAFIAEEGRERLLHYAAAGVEAVLGFLLMVHPVVVVADFTVLVGTFLLVAGLVRLARSLVTHTSGWGWVDMTGAAALLLGACVWLRLPAPHLWFIGLCLAVDFVCHGVSWSAVGLTERALLQPPAPGMADENIPSLTAGGGPVVRS